MLIDNYIRSSYISVVAIMNFWQIVSLLGFVVSSYPFLIGPNNCGECIQQYSTETGEVACDCSSVSSKL